MNPRRSRWLLRLAIVPVIALLALFWAVSQRRHSLTIENRSEQPIAEMNVSIGGQTQTFHDIKAGARLTVEGRGHGDRYTVKGRLANDTLIGLSGPIRDSLDFVLLPNGSLEERRRKDAR